MISVTRRRKIREKENSRTGNTEKKMTGQEAEETDRHQDGLRQAGDAQHPNETAKEREVEQHLELCKKRMQ